MRNLNDQILPPLWLTFVLLAFVFFLLDLFILGMIMVVILCVIAVWAGT